MMRAMAVIRAAVFSAAVCAIACGTEAIRNDDLPVSQYHPADDGAVRGMAGRVTAINKNAPVSFAADFSVDGSLGEKKQRILGSAVFDRKLRAMHVTFLDFIFRSPVAQFFQEGDAIRVYYPVQKQMVVDTFKTFDLANYGGVSIDFNLLHGMATGTFPLIENYGIRQGLEANSGNGSMLILENPRFFQTVSFRDGNPDKVLFMDRRTREKVEIYLKNPITQGECVFFSNVMLVCQQTRLRLDIRFSRVRLNIPVKVKTAAGLNLPPNVRTIKM